MDRRGESRYPRSMTDAAKKALLIDLDGVVYEGERAVDGAVDALRWIRDQGIAHLFLTNTTSRPRSALVEKLAGFGVEADEDDILTPPVAAAAWLRERGAGRVAAFVPEATTAEFSAFDQLGDDDTGPADAVIVGDLGEGWTFARLNRAFRLLMEEPRPHLVALGMTRYWKAEDGLRLDTAPFVVALSHASGAEPVVLGKPATPFFETALAKLGAGADETVMLGDDLRADVGGAQAAGIDGVLVRTGKYRGEDSADDAEPVAVLDSIADLPDWWPGH